MNKQMTATLMALILVGTTMASYESNDPNRGMVLLALTDRDIAEQSVINQQVESRNNVDAVFADTKSHFSGYYQLTSELLY